jgi:hypothetical protein
MDYLVLATMEQDPRSSVCRLAQNTLWDADMDRYIERECDSYAVAARQICTVSHLSATGLDNGLNQTA